MRAIIPAAGIGKRLQPHTYVVPKVLLPVAGKPILGHIVDSLLEVGIADITFVVGYKGEAVKEYINSNYQINAYFVEQAEREGLGHAVWMTRELHYDDPEVLIILGDTIFRADLSKMINQEGSYLAVKEVDDPRRFGIAELDEAGEYIIKLEEKPDKPKSRLAIVGIYLIREPKLLFDCLTEIVEKDIRTKGEYQLTDGLSLMLKRGAKIKPFYIEGWLDCGKQETLLETNRVLLQIKTKPEDREMYQQNYPDSLIRMPVYISPKARLINAIVGPNVSVGESAEIENAIITNSIVCDNSKIKNVILNDSIIGDNALVTGQIYRLNISDSSELTFK